MTNFDKYTRLIILMMATVFGFVIFIALLVFLLRLISMTFVEIPGSTTIYHFLVVIVPYIIFFGAYYYLYGKIKQSSSTASKIIASVLLIVGCIVCSVCLVLVSMLAFGVKRNWLNDFDDNSGYNLVLQLVIVFFTAMSLALGDKKEKDWLERNNEL